MNPDSEKLDDLSKRIRQAEAGAKPAEPESLAAASASAGRVGFDFVGSIAGSCIIGALADHALGTSPWCLLGMVLVGFAVGMWNVWRSMQKPEGKK